MVLVGPSGCGKSTLLRLIAGLEDVDAGAIWIGERDVTELQPRDRDIAMVFQSYALYPHMTVRDNLGYGLKVRKLAKKEAQERVERVARLLRLDELLERRPAALSGGQRQRVAMGRAIVREPQAFLMDEPLSNLDAKLRVGMRAAAREPPRAAPRHDRLRHARPGRGDDAGATRRGDARRTDSAGRHAEGALRAAGQPLRRVVHRLAGDESRRGAAERRHDRVRRPPDRAPAGARAADDERADRARNPARVVRGRTLRRSLAATARRRRGRARGSGLGRARRLPGRRDARCTPRSCGTTATRRR